MGGGGWRGGVLGSTEGEVWSGGEPESGEEMREQC